MNKIVNSYRCLDLDEAVTIFEKLPKRLQIASLHPEMVEISALIDSRLQPIYWFYQDGDDMFLYSFHMIQDDIATDIQSPYGYGGPLSSTNNILFIKDAYRYFDDWIKINNVVVEFLKLHPLVDFSFLYDGNIKKNRETIWINLNKDLLTQYQSRRRAYVRKAKRSELKVKRMSKEQVLNTFVSTYYKNMKDVEANEFYFFTKKYFEALSRSKFVEAWGVFEGKVMLAGSLVIVSTEAGVVEYHLGAKKYKNDKQRSMILLLHSIAAYYQREGYSKFYLGGGRTIHKDDSLLFFKKGFSKEVVDFYIGYKIFNKESYKYLQRKYPEKLKTGKIIFYR